MNLTEIELCERSMDYWIDHNGQRQPKYHVQVKDQPNVWACGRSSEEAVGDLIQSHPEQFGVRVIRLGKLPR